MFRRYPRSQPWLLSWMLEKEICAGEGGGGGASAGDVSTLTPHSSCWGRMISFDSSGGGLAAHH